MIRHFFSLIRRRIGWIFLILFAAVFIAALCIRPYFWTRAQAYSPKSAAQPAVPVMTMAEYGNFVSQHPRPYVLKYTKGSNQLILFGISHHVNDPENADIVELDRLIKAFEPTDCLIEGKLGIWIAGYEGIVKQFGESGAVAWHARQRGTPLHTLDLPLELEVERVVKQHAPEHVAMFYVLRPYFGARRHGPIEDPEAMIAEPLRKRTKFACLKGAVTSVEDIDRIWKRDFTEYPDWRDCADNSGWPGVLNEVGATANLVRNEHWLDVFNEMMSESENARIFAVAGCSHAFRIQRALDSLFDADGANPSIPEAKEAGSGD